MSILSARTKRKATSLAVDDLFSLSIEHSRASTKIHMSVMTALVNTRDIPWTLMLLQEQLPSILHSTCYNDDNIPFAIEVQHTEIGHLFEHILLEYLCEEKLRKGYDEVSFSGRTRWNWQEDPYGLFHIIIQMNIADKDIFPIALEKSISLIKRIITHDSCPMPLSLIGLPDLLIPSQRPS